jgi:predicted Zn-dependent protease with MMP-like domain
MVSAYDRKVLGLMLEEVRDLLDAGDLEQAEATLVEAEAIDPADPSLRTLRAQLALDAGQLDEALAHARVAIEHEPSADAHWVAARVHESRGEGQSRAEHDLEVLRLDAADDLRFGKIAKEDVDAIEAMAESVLESLPPSVADAVGSIPVVLEARPHAGVVEDGFDPRAVGLFEGATAFGDMIADRPVRIVVFYANLLATCRDDAELEEQLRITILHEIGHALGLDEDEVDALGLG